MMHYEGTNHLMLFHMSAMILHIDMVTYITVILAEECLM